MATVVEALLVTLGLDAQQYKKEVKAVDTEIAKVGDTAKSTADALGTTQKAFSNRFWKSPLKEYSQDLQKLSASAKRHRGAFTDAFGPLGGRGRRTPSGEKETAAEASERVWEKKQRRDEGKQRKDNTSALGGLTKLLSARMLGAGALLAAASFAASTGAEQLRDVARANFAGSLVSMTATDVKVLDFLAKSIGGQPGELQGDIRSLAQTLSSFELTGQDADGRISLLNQLGIRTHDKGALGGYILRKPRDVYDDFVDMLRNRPRENAVALASKFGLSDTSLMLADTPRADQERYLKKAYEQIDITEKMIGQSKSLLESSARLDAAWDKMAREFTGWSEMWNNVGATALELVAEYPSYLKKTWGTIKSTGLGIAGLLTDIPKSSDDLLLRLAQINGLQGMAELLTPAKPEDDKKAPVTGATHNETGAKSLRRVVTDFFGITTPALRGNAPQPNAGVNIPFKAPSAALSNNNPLNLRFAGQKGAVAGRGGFARFQDMDAGLAAAWRQLLLYQGRGVDTVRGIIGKWAPPNENNTRQYISHVAKDLNVSPDARLNLANRQTAERLIASMARMEAPDTAKHIKPGFLEGTTVNISGVTVNSNAQDGKALAKDFTQSLQQQTAWAFNSGVR